MNKEIYLILPNIRSSHNVGAMFRIADCFGIKKIFLCGYTPTPPKTKINKVALGTEKWVSWEKCEDVFQLIDDLKREGVQIVGLEKTKDSVDVKEADFSSPLAIVVGEEVAGMDKDLVEKCDRIVHIPMFGKKSSLNVSVAAGIAIHTIVAE